MVDGFGRENGRADDEGRDGPAGIGLRYVCGECGRAHVLSDGGDFDRRLDAAAARLAEAAAQLSAADGLDPAGRWTLDAESATCRVAAPGGAVHLPIATLGEWTPATRAWRWAWGLSEDRVPGRLRHAAERVRDLGLARQWDALSHPVLIVAETDAWRLARFAADLTGHALVLRSRLAASGDAPPTERFHAVGRAMAQAA